MRIICTDCQAECYADIEPLEGKKHFKCAQCSMQSLPGTTNDIEKGIVVASDESGFSLDSNHQHLSQTDICQSDEHDAIVISALPSMSATSDMLRIDETEELAAASDKEKEEEAERLRAEEELRLEREQEERERLAREQSEREEQERLAVEARRQAEEEAAARLKAEEEAEWLRFKAEEAAAAREVERWVEAEVAEAEVARPAESLTSAPQASSDEFVFEPSQEQSPAAVSDPPLVPPTSKEIDYAVTEKSLDTFDEHTTVPRAILRRLSSAEAEERASALIELARVGGDDSFREINAAFDDPAVEVRNAAARSLFNVDTDRAAIFTRALREAPPERRRKIGAALASSGLASEAIGQLMGESREKTYDAFSLLFLMSKAGEVQPLMRAIEEHPNNEVRLAVIKLLALSGQQEILPAFRRLAVRGSLPTDVRSAVMEAISLSQGGSETPQLEDTLSSADVPEEKRRLEEEERKVARAEAQRKAEEEARLRAEEAQRIAAAARAEEAKRKAEEKERLRLEEQRLAAKAAAVEEARRKAEELEQQRQEKKRLRAEEETRQPAEDRRKAEEQVPHTVEANDTTQASSIVALASLKARPSEFFKKYDSSKQSTDSVNQHQLLEQVSYQGQSKSTRIKFITIPTPILITATVIFLLFISLGDVIIKPRGDASSNTENIAKMSSPPEPTIKQEPAIKQHVVIVASPTPEIAAPPPMPSPQAMENKQADVTTVKNSSSEAVNGRFAVQVGSHNDETKANKQAQKLMAAGFEPRVVSVDIPKRGRWYRVQTGSFQTRDEANRYGAQVIIKGAAESFVISVP